LQFKEIILCKGKKINEASAPIATKSKHEWAVNGLSEEGGDSELEALKNETRFGSSGRRTGVGANIGSGGTDRLIGRSSSSGGRNGGRSVPCIRTAPSCLHVDWFVVVGWKRLMGSLLKNVKTPGTMPVPNTFRAKVVRVVP